MRGGSIIQQNHDNSTSAEKRIKSNYRYKGVDKAYSRQPSGTLPSATKLKNAQMNENSAQLELILEDLNKYQ